MQCSSILHFEQFEMAVSNAQNHGFQNRCIGGTCQAASHSPRASPPPNTHNLSQKRVVHMHVLADLLVDTPWCPFGLQW